jgi:hypothetical protein
MNVFPNHVQLRFIADDMFPIVALSQFAGKRRLMMLLHGLDVFIGRHRFEPLRHLGQGCSCIGVNARVRADTSVRPYGFATKGGFDGF